VLTQASRRAVKRRSDLIVERHCFESTDYTVSHAKHLQQLSFYSLPEAHNRAECHSHGVLILGSGARRNNRHDYRYRPITRRTFTSG